MQVFNPSQISLAQLLNEARANRGKISHIYLHWTAGRYNQFFDEYHLNIDGEGKVFRTCSSLDQLKQANAKASNVDKKEEAGHAK